MKIISIETKVENIALKVPFVTALRRVESVEFVRVFVRCEDGSVGVGEAPATFAITGEDIAKILDSIAFIQKDLFSCTLELALEIVHSSTIGSSAKAALDMALVSLQAQEQGCSLATFWGIKDFSPLQSDITISLGNKEEMLEAATRALEAGMDILKIKLGGDIVHAIETTKLLSSHLRAATLLIDANQAWSLEETLHYLESVKECSIALVEQPVIAADLESLKVITNTSSIPILADEAAFTLKDVRNIVESKSADMINIKLMKCGGVTKAVGILEYARVKGVKCMLGSMLEGPYSINAALYLAFAYRDVIAFVDLDSPLLYKENRDELDFHFKGALITLRCGEH